MTSNWSKTWYSGHPECYKAAYGNTAYGGPGQPCCGSCASGGPCEGSAVPKKACCASCAKGGPCEGGGPKPCCASCAKGLPCEGSTSSLDRHQYDKGCRGIGEYKLHPTGVEVGPHCDHPHECFWPLYRNVNMRRAGVPTHKNYPDLYEEVPDDGSGEGAGPETLSKRKYRRIYNFEKEPYFFAKEYEDPFCRKHVSPWSEEGYYYYKGAHDASKDRVTGMGNW